MHCTFRVIQEGQVGRKINVRVGVKQRCILSRLISNIVINWVMNMVLDRTHSQVMKLHNRQIGSGLESIRNQQVWQLSILKEAERTGRQWSKVKALATRKY